MASVRSGDLWLSPLRTVTDVTTARGFVLNSVEFDHAITVATTQRAGGNFDSEFTPGVQRIAKVTVGFASDEDAATLLAWYGTGEPLMARFPQSVKFAAVMDNGATWTPRKLANSWQVPFTLKEFTYSEVSS